LNKKFISKRSTRTSKFSPKCQSAPLKALEGRQELRLKKRLRAKIPLNEEEEKCV
jgi:hypothetical protein